MTAVSAMRVVIGAGPDALRAAAALATAGGPVTLLQEAATPSGLLHPRYPTGTGLMRVSADAWALVEQVLGPVVEAPDPHRAVLARGRRYRLPLAPHQVVRLLEHRVRAPAALAWLSARLETAGSSMTGSGREERSYQDWVERRMGGPAYHHLYRSYARRRWGLDPALLSASLARVHHHLPDPGPFQVAGGGYDEVLRTAQRRIEEGGGAVRVGARVAGLGLARGRVSAVRLETGEEIPVEGPLWAAVDAATLVRWLGDAGAEMAVDASHLPVHDSCTVVLRGEVDGLPDELHVLDERAPFWRVVVPYGLEKTALFHVTLAPDEPTPPALIEDTRAAAAELGIGGFSADGALVERVRRWVPAWRAGSHARLRRLLRRWQGMGIVGVGRSGAFSPMDPGAEIALAGRYRDEEAPDQAEVHRELLDPPVVMDDLGARITRLIQR